MFGWAGAAAGAQQATDDAKKLEMDLQTQLAEREYRRQVIQMQQAQEDRLRQQMAQADRQFTVQQDNLATDRRQAENERGVQTMVGELIRREGITPQNRGQIIGTLVEAGRMPTQADLAPPVDPQAELREYEAKRQIDAKYARPSQGSTPEQQWVMRNGVLTPIPRGTAVLGDVPHDPVAVRQAQGGADPAKAQEIAAEGARIASDLVRHPGLKGAFGVLDERLPTLRQSTRDAEVLRDSLMALLTLDNIGMLKGVLSDSDMRILQQASTTLRPGMGDAAAATELRRLIPIMQKVAAGGGPAAPEAPPSAGVTPSARDLINKYRGR